CARLYVTWHSDIW
nr:immunoglobulin heavy chain junction region [Macaca mulatta]